MAACVLAGSWARAGTKRAYLPRQPQTKRTFHGSLKGVRHPEALEGGAQEGAGHQHRRRHSGEHTQARYARRALAA